MIKCNSCGEEFLFHEDRSSHLCDEEIESVDKAIDRSWRPHSEYEEETEFFPPPNALRELDCLSIDEEL